MKVGMVIALLIGIAIAATEVWGHDADGNPYPPPQNCEERCRDVQCKCHDVCVKSGHDTCCTPGTCKGDCNDRKDDCIHRCQEEQTLEDCRNTDRCAKPRG